MDGNILAQILGAFGNNAPNVSAALPPALNLDRFDPATQMRLGGGPSANLPAIDPAMLTPPPANIMQAAAAPPDMPQSAPVPQDPMQSDEPPRKRRSLLDTVGRLADAIARGAGAPAGYQPTLDAQEDRARLMDTQDLQYQASQQQVDENTDEAAGRQRALIGNAVRGLQAIVQRGGDAAQAWPILAQQAGISPDQTAQLGAIFAANPQAIAGFATMLTSEQNAPQYGMQPFYAQDEQGTLRAYQLGRGGDLRPIQLPEGVTPSDPVRFTNTGGAQVGVGTRSGRVRTILPNTERPGQRGGQPINERPGYSGGRPTAPAPATGGRNGQAAAGPEMAQAALGNLREIRQIYENLHRMGAMVSPSRSTGGNLLARVRASGPGQLAEGAIGTEAQSLRDSVASIRPALMQSIARATGMTGRQLDSNADVRLFMQTVTNPAASYEANIAAIDRLERFLRANTRQAPAATPAAPRNSRPAASRRVNPTGGWGRATVVGR